MQIDNKCDKLITTRRSRCRIGTPSYESFWLMVAHRSNPIKQSTLIAQKEEILDCTVRVLYQLAYASESGKAVCVGK